MNSRHVLLASVLLLGFASEGCGGGGGGGGATFSPPTPTPVPTVPGIPTGAPFTTTIVQSPQLPSAGSQNIVLASGGGVSGSVTLPPTASSGVSLYETISNVSPAGGVPALNLSRVVQSVRAIRSATAATIGFIGIYATAGLDLSATPGFTITLPSPYLISGANYYVALYDPRRPSLGWQLGFEGPATVAGNTLTFSGSSAPFSFAARVSYWFALVAVAAQGAQPTPAPSVSPAAVPQQSPPPFNPTANMHQTFDDEFNGPNNAPVDVTKWASDSGPWSDNQELEYYANVTNPSAPNYNSKYAQQDGQGHVAIAAYAENLASATCWYGPCRYTSARLTTKGIFSQSFGRIEASVKLPPGQGLWPAFWLGDTIGNWPNNAELDALEGIGSAPSTVYGAAHGPGFNMTGPITVSYTLPTGQKLSDAYHVYAMEWQSNFIRYYIDDVIYATVTPGVIPAGGVWEFDHPFYLILNLAVGGSWPGSPDQTTPFPSQMQVDYVRVYQY